MSREEAIEILKNSTMKDTLSEQWQEAYKMAISALEQEPCDTSTDEPMTMVYPTIFCDDAVSREAVVYYIKSHIQEIISESGIDKNEHTNRVLRAIVNGVETMPSVQPSLTKESAIDYLHEIGWMEDHDRQMTEMAEPSRKGHWIIKDRYYHDTITAECSECGREVEISTCMSELMYNGCPYCLADMRGTENESKG